MIFINYQVWIYNKGPLFKNNLELDILTLQRFLGMLVGGWKVRANFKLNTLS